MDLYEVIIVLNGFKEPYYNQLLQFLSDKSNMTLYYTNKKGVSNARNIGLEKAKGEYVSFVDDDDIVSDNYLECLYEKVQESSIVVSNVYNFKSNINDRIKDYLTFEDNSSGIFKNRCYLSNACCKLIPISVIRDKRFDIKFTKGEDAIFMFAISDEIKRIQKTDVNCIYYRRIREMSASRKKMRLIDRLFTVVKQQLAFSFIYIKNPFKYNALLYMSRILAVFKTLMILFFLFISCSEKAVEQVSTTHIAINNEEAFLILEQTRATILNYAADDGGQAIRANVDVYINNFLDGKWLDINYENQQGMADWEPYYHLLRTKELAVAYYLKLSNRNEEIINIVNDALEHWRIGKYVSNNWWFNSIAVCTVVGEILVLLDEYITDENWNYFVKYLDKLSLDDFQGANKIDIATYHFLRGVCLSNDSILSKSVQAAYGELKYIDHEGVQVDGSSLSHDIRYIGGYGEVLFSGIIKIGMFTRGTDYALSVDNVNFISDYLINTYLNSLRGQYIDYIALGRQISRENYLKRISLLPLLKDMRLIDSQNKNIYDEYLKYFVEDLQPRNNKFSHYFWKVDYLLHCNERYNISVGGTSTRIRKPERMNGENILGSLLSLGSTSFRILGDEYYNVFPVWNWNMIPGVTSTMTIPSFEYDGGVYGKSNFSGGVSDGNVSSYVLELNDSGLRGKKGYYTTKDALVCLGNSLESQDNNLLHTCIEQCVYRGNSEIYNIKDKNVIGKICHNNIWYLLLSPDTFLMDIENKTGRWSSINEASYHLSPVIKPIFSIIIEHSLCNYYAYMVIPNPSSMNIVEDLQKNIEILKNDQEMQVVVDKIDSVIYLTFFSVGTFSYNNFTFSVDTPCILMVKNVDMKNIDVYIAEPTQLENKINLKINDYKQVINLPTGDYAGSTIHLQIEKDKL